MNAHEMDKLTAHFDKYFEQSDAKILHPLDSKPHVDILVYPPSDKYPFWKLATMGAGDFKMPGKNSLGNRNEYIMFVSKSEDLTDLNTVSWYRLALMEVVMFPINNNTLISVGHSFEWQDNEAGEMSGAFIDFPQVIEDTGILRCKLGLMKTVICLQVTLLTKNDLSKLLADGPEAFSYYLYPEDDNERMHFLSQRNRTDEF